MNHEDASHAEKVRGTFDELDLKRTRSFGLDEWITILQRLHIDFTLATMRDLFDKADANGDGLVTYSEYQKFCEMFPTTLDSLYYRSKDYWTDIHQLENIEEAKKQERTLKDREEQCRLNLFEAQQVTDKQDHRVHMSAQQLKEAQMREKEQRDNIVKAHAMTEDLRLEVRDRAADHAEARDNERVIQAGLNEARHAVEVTAAQSRNAENDVVKAEEYLMELERKVAEQRSVVDRLRGMCEHMHHDLTHAKSTEQTAVSALLESQRAVQLSGERLSLSEGELEAAIARERDSNDTAATLNAESLRLQLILENETKELLNCKDREKLSRQGEENSLLESQEHLRVLQALQAQNKDFNLQRSDVENEEVGLLEQEVMLREQRESLEDREAKLRTNASNFSTTRRSPSPAHYSKYRSSPMPSAYKSKDYPDNHNNSRFRASSPPRRHYDNDLARTTMNSSTRSNTLKSFSPHRQRKY
eukprot:TRINITY_DN19127_c0_g1_i1.p1 TRINITY_DN19127_c0_g1~~TRINITY_DN19127_c0_g1_i1.p1  ORF type:complete len:491 (+),score=75.22 TRINITY_DN19127_c0_g1_i1:52-1473(+)